jgi:hypothetical protein
MRDFVADRLLQLSSWFYRLSVVCKDAGIRVLIHRRKKAGPLRGNDGAPITHRHTDIMGDR